ncbi:MAG: pyruvate kinase [Deltaproteobacteria bacterium]|nr:MAG: pyruvate kinase [Deltaproteobacteria bacterium]
MTRRRTKIVCTLGPTSDDEATLEKMMRAGMDVARLNFSHGDHETHRALFARVRAVAERLDRPVAILQDLQGPKIRVGDLLGGSLTLAKGSEVTLVYAASTDEPATIPCTYEPLARDVNEGDRILLDDGRLQLRVLETCDGRVEARVEHGGELTNNKGINLPGVTLSTPALTEKDKQDIELGRTLGVDYVALSFVRTPDDVEQTRALISPEAQLIAKIEKPEAVEHFEAILELSDGVMVARGDLGVEMGPQAVPLLQKAFIEAANARCKLVITATEMLESMRTSPRPTRAEVSDVANAVLDGTDALMLSGETAHGEHPVESVQMMDHIARSTEASARFSSLTGPTSLNLRETSNAIAKAAVVATRELGAAAIVCYTESGATALMISEYRPEVPLLAASHDPHVYRMLAAHWGVTPLLLKEVPNTAEEAVRSIRQAAVDRGYVRAGQSVVIASGTQIDGPNDMVIIETI